MSSTTSPADDHGHGTMVGGLAVFGSIRACYSTGLFTSPIRLFSVRVLDANNRFDDEKLVINQIRAAIMRFYRAPHNCRVFNLSVGSSGPAFSRGVDRQTLWAESMDILARELKVVLVISAGNLLEIFGAGTQDAESLVRDYPNHLLAESARLNDPSTAAIAVAEDARTGILSNQLADHILEFCKTTTGVHGSDLDTVVLFFNEVRNSLTRLDRDGVRAPKVKMSLPLKQRFRLSRPVPKDDEAVVAHRAIWLALFLKSEAPERLILDRAINKAQARRAELKVENRPMRGRQLFNDAAQKYAQLSASPPPRRY
jgi:hypothetical protein